MSDEMDFGKLFEASINQVKTDLRTGEKVTGYVTAIKKGTVILDLGLRSDGLMDLVDFQDKEGNTTLAVGDQVTAYNMGMENGYFRLQLRAGRSSDRSSGPELDASLQDAYQANIPVEGKVTAERKGGFTVEVAGAQAFCPFSQIDLRNSRKDAAVYIGNTYSFIITEFNAEEKNIVLSRRRILEEEAARLHDELKGTLAVDEVREVTITRILPFGAFADLGGIEGLIPVSELSWERNINPEELLQPGQKVNVKIIRLEWAEESEAGKERVTLSLKRVAANPNAKEEEKENLPTPVESDEIVTGEVESVKQFGVFVKLPDGNTGLLHVSQCNLGDNGPMRSRELIRKFPLHAKVDVIIRNVEGSRISLTLPEVREQERERSLISEYHDAGNAGFGSMGDAFANLKL